MSLFPQSGFKHSKEETESWNRYWEVTNVKEKEFEIGEEKICNDCMRSHDDCPDCCDGDKYCSPDSYERDMDK